MNSIKIYQDTPDVAGTGFNNCDSHTNGEFALLPHLIKSSDVVFDIGANRGQWSRQALSVNKSIRLHSFEPSVNVFVGLKNNLAGTNTSLHNIAISDGNGQETFYQYNSCPTLSSLYRRSSVIEKRLHLSFVSTLVQTCTLDSFCENHSISHVDFVKIDTEGSELDVLRGAINLLREHKIKIVQFEYGGTYPDAGITLREVCELLSLHKYVIFRILSDGIVHIAQWHNSLENSKYSNYLAVSSEKAGSYKVMTNLLAEN